MSGHKVKESAGLTKVEVKDDGTTVFHFGRGGVRVDRAEIGRVFTNICKSVAHGVKYDSAQVDRGLRFARGCIAAGPDSKMGTQFTSFGGVSRESDGDDGVWEFCGDDGDRVVGLGGEVVGVSEAGVGYDKLAKRGGFAIRGGCAAGDGVAVGGVQAAATCACADGSECSSGEKCREASVKHGQEKVFVDAVPVVLLGPNGGVSFGRGPKYAERCLQRLRRKEAKQLEKLARLVGKNGTDSEKLKEKENENTSDFGEFGVESGRCGNGGRAARSDEKTATVPEWRRKEGFSVGAEKTCRSGSDNKDGFFSVLTDLERNNLVRSRASRLAMENRLAEEKARRGLILLEASDIEAEKKRQYTRTLRDTECNKASIEKAFASLAVSGNVPGVGGSVKTVVSGSEGSGTISPNSSVSMQEVRAMMQELESLRLENARFRDKGFVVKKEKSSTVYTADENGDYPSYMYDVEPNCGDFELRDDGKYHKIYRDYVW